MEEPPRHPKFDFARWDTQRCRLQLDRDFPEKPRRQIKTVADVLDSVVEKLGLDERRVPTALEENWEEIVGKQIAKHARPGHIENGVLNIYVIHPVWMNELQRFHKKPLLAKIRKQMGERVKDLKFRPGPG